MNRLASLTDFDSLNGDAHKQSHRDMSPFNLRQQSSGPFQSSGLNINSSSYLSVMSNGSRQPRSNSMIGKTIPASNHVSNAKLAPIDGSFIVVDESRRKLSDMGNYKHISRNSGQGFAPGREPSSFTS